MNSNYGNPNVPQRTPASLNNFNFDFGIGSNKPKSLNDQRNVGSGATNSYSYASTQPSKPAWQSNKPSWTHQPAPAQSGGAGSLSGPTSMVGDIFGKSWSSMGSSGSGTGIGIPKKDPSLFGDLVSSALGPGKSSASTGGNAPLKSAGSGPAASASKSAYSMGSMADSLPKAGNGSINSGSWGSSGYSTGSGIAGVNRSGINANNNVNLGGPAMKSMAGGVGGVDVSNDPFSGLAGFNSKQQSSDSLNSTSKASSKDAFGDFQNAATSNAATFSSSSFGANNSNFAAANPSFNLKTGNFGMPAKEFSSESQNKTQSSGVDHIDMFSSAFASAAGGAAGGQKTMEADDWGFDSDFGGNDVGGSTTELEGLPPPPAGVSASTAKNKGMDNYKQGQYADAIKWLSWAVILLEKSGDNSAIIEVLSCRASCYKEAGEYKKAVADCTKVLEGDDANVAVLVQRALLYESMEKYRLGAEDLRTVLKIDPGNRIARSTVHRLTKMAD